MKLFQQEYCIPYTTLDSIIATHRIIKFVDFVYSISKQDDIIIYGPPMKSVWTKITSVPRISGFLKVLK